MRASTRVSMMVLGVCALALPALAQPQAVTPPDPRVGLAAGFEDAAVAAHNMELVGHAPRPEGFFDPKAPAGEPTPPPSPEESDAKETTTAKPDASAAGKKPETARKAEEAKPEKKPFTGLNFANSDLAFSGTHLFIGNFNGFNVYDVADPRAPRLVTSVACPGGQGDVSVYGNLLFMSVEQTRGRLDCGTGGVEDPVSAERFRGVRIFDITDVATPRQVAAVQTCRGSHTHTLVTNPADTSRVYIYGSGTAAARSPEELEGCSAGAPKDDPKTALFSIDVIEVPVATPQNARIVNRPRIFADEKSGAISGLWQGGDHGPGTQKTSVTNQCHDITVFPEVGLAAGACSGNGILLDISDPVKPVRLDAVSDKNFAYWHSATFNNDGTKVVFTDEWGGGLRPRCLATDLPNWGADAIFDIVDRKLRFASYYKLPAAQSPQENCVAHNGSLVPVPGRDLKVQAWYQGGASMFDFTDTAHPVEIAYFDRGPLDKEHLITGGYWSTYWYNGFVYGAEMARGLDVLALTPGDQLTQHEIDAAKLVHVERFNAQHQVRISWPAHPTVARAYLDQLARTKGIAAARTQQVVAALDAAERGMAAAGTSVGSGQSLDVLAAHLVEDAASAHGADAVRLRALADTLKGMHAAQAARR